MLSSNQIFQQMDLHMTISLQNLPGADYSVAVYLSGRLQLCTFTPHSIKENSHFIKGPARNENATQLSVQYGG